MQQWVVSGKSPPLEIEMYFAVRQYGAQAVMGRALGVSEVRLLNYIEKTITEYRKQAGKNG